MEKSNIIIDDFNNERSPLRKKYGLFVDLQLKSINRIIDGHHSKVRRGERNLYKLITPKSLDVLNVTRAEIIVDEKGSPISLSTFRTVIFDMKKRKLLEYAISVHTTKREKRGKIMSVWEKEE